MNDPSPVAGVMDSSNFDIPDLAERRRALDPAHSFIVQAPAGSGKTGLLIQRYLKLLTCVNDPEEIVAITFTRKAAGEMRERVIEALSQARGAHSSISPDTGHMKFTRDLADAAVRRDIEAGWRLTENPGRLRIQTFDSLCASLNRQMPILSGFGSQPETVEDASDLYREAARLTIDLVESNEAAGTDVEYLLEHLDNDLPRVESLIAEMLARRDHWLRHIHCRSREELEAALRRTGRETLRYLRRLFAHHPEPMQGELVELLRYAAQNLAASGWNSVEIDYEQLYAQLSGLGALPGEEAHDYACWYAIAELLLTREGAWRKQHTVKDGFPTVTKGRKDVAKEWKERACTLVSSLATHEDGNLLCQALHDVRILPPSCYTEKQWDVLGSIMQLLPLAVAQLRLVFQSRNKVDFTEVTQGALRGLGEPEMPTDLALALDYRIRHILIDEFQDTSISQYELVARLTAGWERGDGRTMFIVGDPMQSIYRFRQAEVGLFLRARAAGIGNITLHPISLSANFRSQRGIVDWVNTAFAQIMPEQEDISLGATPYIASAAMHDRLDDAAVSIHPFFDDDHAGEAMKVVEITLEVQKNAPSATMAILVRNRSHLHEIAPRLRNAGLRFRAIEIEGLAFRPIVQDLLALTRALIHPGDRLAWLALLRAPWCGLTLADIHALASVPGRSGIMESTVWELLNDDSCVAKVSADGQARLARIREILKVCLDNRNRQGLRETVEAAWLALSGPACVDNEAELGDATAYFDHLEAHERAGAVGHIGLGTLEEGLARLYALPDLKAEDRLQVMTIHKAKGLEFDHVILPGLGRTSRSNDKRLFMWMEHLRIDLAPGETDYGDDLLLAPIQETGADVDRIYAWLEKLEGEKERLEDERLLYVGATRARKRLHLLGSTGLMRSPDGQYELRPPARKSLLSKIWSVLQPIYEEAAAAKAAPASPASSGEEPGKMGEDPIDQSLRRLVSNWVMPAAPPAIRWRAQQSASSTRGDIEYSWAGETARHIGNIVHGWLRHIAEDGLENWNVLRIDALRNTVRQQLAVCGMDRNSRETDTAVARIIAALLHAVNDERGRWLLGAQQDASNELHMTAIIKGQIQDLVIDRTFRDADGQRWIVDYKTSSHEGADLEGFLNREKDRYRAQLDRYAELMRRVDNKPVRRGLYFPLLKGWREWGDEV
jgi:ATP-dependent exoDNAse (exonuclease V) beta subunit